jgi:hypothetical protein
MSQTVARDDEFSEFLTLLRRAVNRHRPDLDELLPQLGKTPLSVEQRESLRGVLADELCANGLREDDEPNEYGLRIEAAIDHLGEL